MKPNQPEAQKPESPEETIRQIAYFRWIDNGGTHGNDWDHWFAAEKQLLSAATMPETTAEAATNSPEHYSIRTTLAAHLSDPTHKFHAPGTVHDARLDVAAGEAPQRVRARQPRGS